MQEKQVSLLVIVHQQLIVMKDGLLVENIIVVVLFLILPSFIQLIMVVLMEQDIQKK